MCARVCARGLRCAAHVRTTTTNTFIPSFAPNNTHKQGGGHNALVAAVLLARQGLKVALFEEKGVVGGACRTEHPFPKVPGLGHSTGAFCRRRGLRVCDRANEPCRRVECSSASNLDTRHPPRQNASPALDPRPNTTSPPQPNQNQNNTKAPTCWA
jgi:hypothetical protein